MTEPSDSETVQVASRALKVLGTIVAPATFLTALLYYFAWTREGAIFGYFGVDQSAIGFSTADYLLRAPEVAFRPLIWFLAVAGVVLGAEILLAASLRNAPNKARFAVAISVLTLGLFLFGYGLAVALGYAPVPISPIRAPIALGIGAAIAECGATLLLLNRPAVEMVGRRMLAGLLIVVSIFWATTLYGQHLGRQLARGAAARVGSDAGIIVFSSRDLGITGPGVVSQIAPEGNGLRYRYCGLRLLIHGAGRWFLLPASYQHDKGDAVIVVSDDTTTRVDISLGGAIAHPDTECTR